MSNGPDKRPYVYSPFIRGGESFVGYSITFEHLKLYPIIVKPGKIKIFKKNCTMIILIINCHNGLGKRRKFSRSQMTKRIAPLNSSREI